MHDNQPYNDSYDDYLDPNELTPLRLIGGIGLGSVGALLGALIWAAMVVKLGVESGLVALGIGALTGGGVSLGSQRARGLQLQIIAACIALIGYASGKLIISVWVVTSFVGGFSLELIPDFTQVFMESLSIFDLLWAGIAAYMATSMLKNG